METVLSGIRPTGNLHLGNYFGALSNFVKMQHEHNCYFFIADYHSLTTHPNPENLHNNVKMVLAEYLACGLDPNAATIYIQSDLPETAELYLLLNMNAYLGELERCTSFKEKIRKQVENVNAGLLTYPTLMAADILIHKATKVPVGKDQEQHLEMTRNFANRFNHIYKTEYFAEPVAFNFGKDLVKIPGLDGSGKMGKSEGTNNAIFLIDEPDVISKKVMRAKTDTGPTQQNQQKPEEIQTLFDLMKIMSTPNTLSYFEDKYNACEIRYGDMKKQLAQDIITFTSPIREKIKEIASDNAYLKKVAKIGAEKAKESGAKTVKEVREIIGFKSF
ncbi:MAG TPA: tryptophan--tRNA ligase [Bacteroidales bacterium]|nr:MAG: tryptophan--tRNA ligase [Bacteroidetes bacterium GWF2_33_38]OFY72859.1 MAG: tryptophan--tRNA ligase [Bacteroidetes bacterium RIFOXYA12_FULL_33_9]OFY88940.1 MAG: tryptophan--tRNA ligase [Bacteroidetes bacterium RIFOXYA2_FULL_33_7]HBF87549.1 tryptophan--tRNA ligase [Bacteroidales bacterium]